MLSNNAEKIINQYFNLPFAGVDGVRCPYFINSRKSTRAQLRVLAGKGSPSEIVEESKIISAQYRLGLFDREGSCIEKNKENIQKFLVDQNLGIDCSGFVSHVLKEHFLETKKINITKALSICPPDKFFRALVCKLRPIENMDVKIFGDCRNSELINPINNYNAIKPGDYIIMVETGPLKKRNHIILITENSDNTLTYIQSRRWMSDGTYGHGVSRGKIEIQNSSKSILDQKWTESNKTNEENETYLEAKQANRCEIRRLKI